MQKSTVCKAAVAWIVAPLVLAVQSGRCAQVVDTLTVAPEASVGDIAWDGSSLWTMGSSSPILRCDPRSGEIVQRIDVGLPRVLSFGLDWDGTQLWAAAADGLYRLDPANGRISGPLRLHDPDGLSDVLAIAFKDREIWVLQDFGGAQSYLSRVDPQTGVVTHVMLRNEPQLTGLAWDGSAFEVCSYANDMIYRIDPVSGRILSQFPSPTSVGSSPMGLGWDGHYLWVSAYPHFYKIDMDAQPYETLGIARSPRGPRYAGRGKDVDWDAGSVWYSEVYDQTIYRLDTSLPAPVVTTRFDLRFAPVGVARAGTSLWTTPAFSTAMVELDATSGDTRRILPFPRGREPLGMEFDGTNLWVVGASDTKPDSLFKISTTDGTVVGGLLAPGTGATGIAWDGHSLWNTDERTDLLYELDPVAGTVLARYQLPVGMAQGVAFDPQRRTFWVTDNLDRLYELTVPSGSTHLLEFASAVSDSDIGLAWTPTRGNVTRTFVVERSVASQSGFQEVARLDAPQDSYHVRDGQVEAGHIYYYRVQAIAANGSMQIFGPLSVAYHFTYPAIHTPVVVTALSASADSNGVFLRWTLSGQAATDLAGVDVERAGAAAGPYEIRTQAPLAPAPAMSFLDPESLVSSFVWYRLALIGRDGTRAYSDAIAVARSDASTGGAQLQQPLVMHGGRVRVSYTIAHARAPVVLSLYNVRGHLVSTLDRGPREPGAYAVYWDRRDGSNAHVGRGVYLVRLRAGNVTATRKLVLIGSETNGP